jgi:hypothetical protein
MLINLSMVFRDVDSMRTETLCHHGCPSKLGYYDGRLQEQQDPELDNVPGVAGGYQGRNVHQM